jgi:hypothetical protein
MIVVCHRCGIDLALATCAICLGPCKEASCARCGGHYCHQCLATHKREDVIAELRATPLTQESLQFAPTSVAATSRTQGAVEWQQPQQQ